MVLLVRGFIGAADKERRVVNMVNSNFRCFDRVRYVITEAPTGNCDTAQSRSLVNVSLHSIKTINSQDAGAPSTTSQLYVKRIHSQHLIAHNKIVI